MLYGVFCLGLCVEPKRVIHTIPNGMGYTVRSVLYTMVYALSAPSFLRWYAGDRRHKFVLFFENVNYMFTT